MDILKTDGENEEKDIFTFDVPDEALEIAGSSVQMNFTWGVCTMDQPGCPV